MEFLTSAEEFIIIVVLYQSDSMSSETVSSRKYYGSASEELQSEIQDHVRG